MITTPTPVTPVKRPCSRKLSAILHSTFAWIPAFAGMTEKYGLPFPWIPALARVTEKYGRSFPWIPAFAGMTEVYGFSFD